MTSIDVISVQWVKDSIIICSTVVRPRTGGGGGGGGGGVSFLALTVLIFTALQSTLS